MQLPEISIHAPREGGDLHQRRPTQRRADFNPRPREGATMICNDGDGYYQFQSTPPARGRQANGPTYDLVWVFQSTPPRGGRP